MPIKCTTLSRQFASGLLVCLVAISACGRRDPDYASIGLVEVTGRVTRNGQPLSGAYIVFESADGRKADAVTDARGNYRLNYNSEQTGVLPGEMKVRIYEQPLADEFGDDADDTDAPATQGDIPAKYNLDTKLTASVAPERAQQFDFELESE